MSQSRGGVLLGWAPSPTAAHAVSGWDASGVLPPSTLLSAASRNVQSSHAAVPAICSALGPLHLWVGDAREGTS